MLGSRLTTLNTGPDFCKFAREAAVAVVDIDPIEHTKKSIEIDYLIQADVGQFLQAVEELGVVYENKTWMDQCLHWKQLFSGVEKDFQSSELVDLYQL